MNRPSRSWSFSEQGPWVLMRGLFRTDGESELHQMEAKRENQVPVSGTCALFLEPKPPFPELEARRAAESFATRLGFRRHGKQTPPPHTSDACQSSSSACSARARRTVSWRLLKS